MGENRAVTGSNFGAKICTNSEFNLHGDQLPKETMDGPFPVDDFIPWSILPDSSVDHTLL